MTVIKTKSETKKREGEDETLADQSLIATWKSFQSGTTSHGLPHIINAKGWFKKLLWLLSTCICLIGLGFNYYQLCVKYLSYDVNVAVTLEHAKWVEFPAVTVCNNNPIKRSAIPRNSSLLCVMMAYQNEVQKKCNTTQLKSNYTTTASPHTFSLFATGSSLGTTDSADNENCLSDSGMTGEDGSIQRSDYVFHGQFLEEISSMPDKVKSQYGHKKKRLLKDCTFGGAACDLSDFDEFFNNYHGNCYVFNSKMFNSQDKKLRITRKTGPRFGLSLLFNLEQKDFIGELTTSAGLKVVIHDPTRMPFPEDEGILVAPNSLTNIGVTMEKTHKLDGLYGDCYNEERPRINFKTIYQDMYNSTYSEKGCHYTCLTNELQKECGCIDIKFPISENTSSTRLKPCSSKNQSQVNCQNRIWSMYDQDKLECSKQCTVPCIQTIYKPSISTERWPSKKHQESMLEIAPLISVAKEIMNESSEDYGMVNIFIQDFTYTAIVETPAYEWQDFVSDIGGILGLYVGFSLLTIIEFVELFIDIGRLIAMKAFCRGKTKRKEEDNDPAPVYSQELKADQVGSDLSLEKNPPEYEGLSVFTVDKLGSNLQKQSSLDSC